MSDISEAVSFLGSFSNTGLSGIFPAVEPWAAAVLGRLRLACSWYRVGQSRELVESSEEEGLGEKVNLSQ